MPRDMSSQEPDIREFLNSDALSESLFCPICQDVFTSPRRAPCGHSYCKTCIDKWLKQCKNNPTCPLDRKPFKKGELHDDFIVENIIGDILVACPFRSFGCQTICKLGLLSSHKKSCSFNVNNMPDFIKSKSICDPTSYSKNTSGASTSATIAAAPAPVVDATTGEVIKMDESEDGMPSVGRPPLRMRLYQASEERRKLLENMLTAPSDPVPELETLLEGNRKRQKAAATGTSKRPVNSIFGASSTSSASTSKTTGKENSSPDTSSSGDTIAAAAAASPTRLSTPAIVTSSSSLSHDYDDAVPQSILDRIASSGGARKRSGAAYSMTTPGGSARRGTKRQRAVAAKRGAKSRGRGGRSSGTNNIAAAVRGRGTTGHSSSSFGAAASSSSCADDDTVTLGYNDDGGAESDDSFESEMTPEILAFLNS